MYGNNVRTTETDTNFVANYTEKTRLGFIGTRFAATRLFY